VGETVSAVPEQLAAFDDTVADAAAALLRHSRAFHAALAALARTRSVGLTALPVDLGPRVVAHARQLLDLGGTTGRVGAAFAAAGSGAPAGVVRVDGTFVEDLLALWDQTDAAAGQLPDDAPAIVPGANGCPALAVPTWFRLGGRDDQPETYDEPLWTGLQSYCRPELRPEPEEETWIGETQTGLITGPGGITIGIGQIVEARGGRGRGGRGGRGQAPAPEPPPDLPVRVMPIERANSEVWSEAHEYRGPVRRLDDGSYIMWDHTHGEIEVFHRRTYEHLGVMDPMTGEMIKDPVPGRKLPERYQ
jgi:hypothetical protein